MHRPASTLHLAPSYRTVLSSPSINYPLEIWSSSSTRSSAALAASIIVSGNGAAYCTHSHPLSSRRVPLDAVLALDKNGCTQRFVLRLLTLWWPLFSPHHRRTDFHYSIGTWRAHFYLSNHQWQKPSGIESIVPSTVVIIAAVTGIVFALQIWHPSVSVLVSSSIIIHV